MERSSPWPMISIAEANRISLSHTCPAAAVRLPLAELQGRILAEDVVAVEAVPAVPTSIMDGYAVVSADGAGEFPVLILIPVAMAATWNASASTIASQGSRSPASNSITDPANGNETLP